jgi:hypothetical protein
MMHPINSGMVFSFSLISKYFLIYLGISCYLIFIYCQFLNFLLVMSFNFISLWSEDLLCMILILLSLLVLVKTSLLTYGLLQRMLFVFMRISPLPSMVVHVCNPGYVGGRDMRIMSSKPAKAFLSETLSQKQNKNQGAGGIAQIVQWLLSKHEALCLSPSTADKLLLGTYVYNYCIFSTDLLFCHYKILFVSSNNLKISYGLHLVLVKPVQICFGYRLNGLSLPSLYFQCIRICEP